MGVSMPAPPIGVTPNAGVAAPQPGVAPPIMGVAEPSPALPMAGVSSHRDRAFPDGVAATAGVSPAAQPGVAPGSICEHRQTQVRDRCWACSASDGCGWNCRD